jgi:hypothetical protein
VLRWTTISGLVLLGLMAASSGLATTYAQLSRPLTAEETLERSAARASAILVGTLLGLRDSTLGSGDPYREYRVRPERWLKGSGDGTPIKIAVPAWALMETPVRPQANRVRHVLVFLMKVGDGWVLGQHGHEAGIVPLDTVEREELILAVQKAIDRVSLDSLAVRADWIVIGEALPVSEATATMPCRIAGLEDWCRAFRVDLWIAGGPGEPVIPVYSVTYVMPFHGSGLLFLEQGPNSVYEVLSAGIGGMPVREGRVAPMGLFVDDVIARIRAVRELAKVER